MTPKLRYSFVPPISGGEQFWLINDMEEMFAVVSISVKYPNAEQVAMTPRDDASRTPMFFGSCRARSGM